MKMLRKIWPVPVPEDALNPPAIFEKYANAQEEIGKCDDPTLQLAIAELSKELFEHTRDKRNHIEARATAIVNISGICLALLGGLATLFFQDVNKLHGLAISIALIVIFITLVYLLGAMLAAQAVYGRIVRATLDPSDIVPAIGPSKECFVFLVGVRRIEYAVFNYKSNNRAVGLVYAARDRLRYGIGFLVFAAGTVVLTQTLKLDDVAKIGSPIISNAAPASVSAPMPINPAAPVSPLPPAHGLANQSPRKN